MPNIIFDIPKVSLACFNLITVICPYFTVYEETWHLRFALDWTQVSLLKYWHASFFLKKRTLDKDYAGKTYHRKVMSVALNNFDVTFLPGLTTCYNYLTGQKMFRFGATWGERGLNRTNKCYQLNYPAVLLLKISIIYKFLSQILNFHWLLQELLSADRHRLSLGNTVYLSATPFISRFHRLSLGNTVYLSATFRPRTHGNVFLHFCIVYCSQENREQPAHYLIQYKKRRKTFPCVWGASDACSWKNIYNFFL